MPKTSSNPLQDIQLTAVSSTLNKWLSRIINTSFYQKSILLKTNMQPSETKAVDILRQTSPWISLAIQLSSMFIPNGGLFLMVTMNLIHHLALMIKEINTEVWDTNQSQSYGKRKKMWKKSCFNQLKSLLFQLCFPKQSFSNRKKAKKTKKEELKNTVSSVSPRHQCKNKNRKCLLFKSYRGRKISKWFNLK